MSVQDAAVVSVFVGAVVGGLVWILSGVLANMMVLKKRIGQRKSTPAPPPEA